MRSQKSQIDPCSLFAAGEMKSNRKRFRIAPRWSPVCFFVGCCLLHVPGRADDVARLATDLTPLTNCLSGMHDAFQLRAEVDVEIDGSPQHVVVEVARFANGSFDCDITHEDYAAQILRRPSRTALVLPKHGKAFVGDGQPDQVDNLNPTGLIQRLISSDSLLTSYSQLLQGGDNRVMGIVLTRLLSLEFDAATNSWRRGEQTSIKFSNGGSQVDVEADGTRVRLTVGATAPSLLVPKISESLAGMEVVTIKRSELEKQLVRGVRRAGEILLPGPSLTSPRQSEHRVDHGELKWINGQRVAILHGTPEQIGRAHAELLRAESNRCIDSVLYTFGTAQTIMTGSWFRHDLDQAYARLAPHIPERHQQECRSLAAELGLDPTLMETLNVFPELFHCSGFAVFGSATSDGTLYHGRVLDYMTTIGLQDAATTFVIAPKGKIPFANVGYAGFIGSVSGMNAEGISLGEMGGKGEGQWDGVPMATLMRRALEECETLDDVIKLWTDSPRTCEYYYVFADGKTNRCVGVAATPEEIEFVAPGEAHELLGPGIKDAVVLSAGSRLEKLRERVQQRHGEIDEEVATWLMSRPVAMESNLHNVLFIPARRELLVANASHDQPAAERPYVKLDLDVLLSNAATAAGNQPVAVFNDSRPTE